MPRSRRHFLSNLAAMAALLLAPEIAMADKGSGGGSSGGSDSSGSGRDDGDDSGGDDSGGKDGDGDNDNGNNDDDNEIDQDEVRDAVASGEAMSLRKAMKRAKDHTEGRIINISLVRKRSKFIYVFTVVEASGRIETLKMDAVSGRFAGLLGF